MEAIYIDPVLLNAKGKPADPYDSPDFDPIAHINAMFPDGMVLRCAMDNGWSDTCLEKAFSVVSSYGDDAMQRRASRQWTAWRKT